MPPARLSRRDAVRLLALLAVAPAAGAVAAAEESGVEIRFDITREAHLPSGEFASRRFANSMTLAFGETMEVDFRDQFRISLSPADRGSAAEVSLWLWDNQDRGNLAGNGLVAVPIGGEATLTLLTSDNIRYAIVLNALRRSLPPR